jgi:transposase-like protein
MPIQVVCPHCDSKNVERMKDRNYEAASTNTWYQCCDCKRMWSLRKEDTSPTDKCRGSAVQGSDGRLLMPRRNG